LPQSIAAAFPPQHGSLQPGTITTCSVWHPANDADVASEPMAASAAAATGPHSVNNLRNPGRMVVLNGRPSPRPSATLTIAAPLAASHSGT